VVGASQRLRRSRRLAVGELLAQLKRQLAEQELGLVEQVPAALEDRAARLVPQHQQLGLLVGARRVAGGALECPGQQRVRERLACDPLGVERVGLAALTPPVCAWRSVRAHVAHVVTGAGQEHRRVPTPAGGVLDPPARDRTELKRPRLQRAVALAGDAEVPAGDDPTARVDNRRGQRPLVRVDPDHVRRARLVDQHARRPRTPSLGAHRSPSSPAGDTVGLRTGRQHRGGRSDRERSYQVRPIPEGHEPRSTTSAQGRPIGAEIWSGSGLGSACDPNASRHPRGHPISTPGYGVRFALPVLEGTTVRAGRISRRQEQRSRPLPFL